MNIRDWFRPPRHLLALFVAATVVPALALGWIAWLSLGQDAALDRQRVQDTLESAVGKAVADLQRRLEEQSRQLQELARTPALSLSDDSVLLRITDVGIVDRPSGRLLYHPRPPVAQFTFDATTKVGPGARDVVLDRATSGTRENTRDVTLDAATALEVRAQNPSAAVEVFRRAADSRDRAVQAQALLGLARCLRKLDRPQEALNVYDRLATLGTLSVDGSPAELVARHARCALLTRMKAPELQTQARGLIQDLLRPRWVLDRASFEFYSEEARGWLPTGAVPPPDPARLALADAAGDVVSLRSRQNGVSGRGWMTTWHRDRVLLVVWQNTPQELVALVSGASWFQRPSATWTVANLAVVLTDADSHVVFGRPDQLSKPIAVGSIPDTGLPWTIRIASADPTKIPSLLARSRRMVYSGLAIVGVLIVVGGVLVGRALSRELAVARLQSDFVAAVSHEFRSPLTSMKHLIEMLDQGAVQSEDRRRQYYRVLNGEAGRLHQMVENLLNFGRMEAGKAEYRFERLEARELTEQVAAEFGGQLVSRARLVIVVQGEPVYVRADREPLSRALHNLLDNAAKYSPPSAPIRLTVAANATMVSIRVQDEGPGIPADERKMIFTKFYRGAEAKTSGAKGTGLGLATVQHIVGAHHGEILVESTPGHGSTFTIVLPVAKEQAV